MAEPAFHISEDNRGQQIADYWPLAALFLVSLIAAFALNSAAQLGVMGFMHFFMGFFLSIFALLKLFTPMTFAKGFRMYDLLAKHVPAYSYVYPLIELGLGLAYFALVVPQLVYTLTIVVFLFGALGVIFALRRGLDINCPCMGSILSVPLSTVTLTEDLAMVGMAAFMLAQTI